MVLMNEKLNVHILVYGFPGKKWVFKLYYNINGIIFVYKSCNVLAFKRNDSYPFSCGLWSWIGWCPILKWITLEKQ